jgi:hypothetical protein
MALWGCCGLLQSRSNGIQDERISRPSSYSLYIGPVVDERVGIDRDPFFLYPGAFFFLCV